jgi:tRNA-dihydrouridine synthase 3
MKEVEREDGRKELILIEDTAKKSDLYGDGDDDSYHPGVVNVVSAGDKAALEKRRVKLEKSDEYIKWLERDLEKNYKYYNKKKGEEAQATEDYRANYIEPPLKPSEKRKIYFGAETPVLAPLTTQGNLPFRRICVELGAQVTYSEMALGLPLIQGFRQDWAVMRAHESETTPPSFKDNSADIVQDYDNSRDLKFGAQIAAKAPWIAIRATEALTRFLPHLRLVDLNCGCPIDMLFKSGAGSALLESPAKLERMIRGMSSVSGEIPVTAKIRIGVKEGKPTAQKIIERLAFGGQDMRDILGAPGCAAVTLHGRTRAQRYTRSADWGFIAECAALIKSYQETSDDLTDTMREPEANTLANTAGGNMYFLGNGDCFTYLDYYEHLEKARVDSVMIGRGALIKPWIFEEIQKGQHLDKSASERLAYIEKFCRYGLEAWGSDELGIGYTRRFLLEFLSFYYRYIPVGILEHVPQTLSDRPPAYHGRNDLETLLASDNFKDWIKIRYVHMLMIVTAVSLPMLTLLVTAKCSLVLSILISNSSPSTSQTVMRWKPKASCIAMS